MNKKGQTIFTVGFILLVGILTWAFLASTINTWGHQAALQSSTGLEAFLWDNLNLWVFFGLLCFGAIGVYITGSNQ